MKTTNQSAFSLEQVASMMRMMNDNPQLAQAYGAFGGAGGDMSTRSMEPKSVPTVGKDWGATPPANFLVTRAARDRFGAGAITDVARQRALQQQVKDAATAGSDIDAARATALTTLRSKLKSSSSSVVHLGEVRGGSMGSADLPGIGRYIAAQPNPADWWIEMAGVAFNTRGMSEEKADFFKNVLARPGATRSSGLTPQLVPQILGQSVMEVLFSSAIDQQVFRNPFRALKGGEHFSINIDESVVARVAKEDWMEGLLDEMPENKITLGQLIMFLGIAGLWNNLSSSSLGHSISRMIDVEFNESATQLLREQVKIQEAAAAPGKVWPTDPKDVQQNSVEASHINLLRSLRTCENYQNYLGTRPTIVGVTVTVGKSAQRVNGLDYDWTTGRAELVMDKMVARSIPGETPVAPPSGAANLQQSSRLAALASQGSKGVAGSP